MGARIRTILLVTLVTLLIWVWAEGESVDKLSPSARIVFVGPSPAGGDDGAELVIRPTTDSWRGTARVQLEGSTIAIRAAEAELAQAVKLRPGQPGVPDDAGDNRVVYLKDALRSYLPLKQTGVTIVDVDPPSVVVNIIRLVRRELPVRAELPPEVEVAGEATVTPAKVTVKMAESEAKGLSDTAVASAAVGPDDLRRVRDDAPVQLQAPVRLPAALAGNPDVTVTPERVTVTLRLKRSVESLVVPSVPVWVALPPTEATRWDVEVLDQFLRNVTITGPADRVRQIRDRTVAPIAEVRLTSDELEKGVDSKNAELVGVPPGVEWSVDNRAVRLKITRRGSTPGPPAGTRGPAGETGG